MENISIINQGDELVLRLNRKDFDESFLISLVKRLQLEALAQKSGFTSKILDIGKEINEEWWKKNGDDFLKSEE